MSDTSMPIRSGASPSLCPCHPALNPPYLLLIYFEKIPDAVSGLFSLDIFVDLFSRQCSRNIASNKLTIHSYPPLKMFD